MTTPERSPDRASVRYHDPRDGRPGPDGPAGGDWTERLALRNWSLPVKLTAVLLVPTLFVLTLGVLRIMEQTRDAAEFDGVQQAVALEDGTARVMGSLADERSAAAVYVAAGRAGGSGPVEERIGATRDATSELRRSSGLADSLDEQTRTSFDQADAELDQLDRLRDDVIDGRVDAAGAIARYTEVVDTLEIFDRSLSREAADPSVAGLASGLYSLSVVREEDAYVQAVVAAGIAAGRIDAPSIDQARNATLRRSIAVDDFRSAVGTDNAGLADAVVGPDVDNRDLLAQVVLGRGAAGLPLQVSGPDWERASSAVEDRDAATSEQLRGQLQEQAGALQQAARNGAGVASVILLLALMAGAAVVFFVTRSLLRPLRLLRRSALDVAERRLPQAVRSLREGEAPDTTIVPTPITTREEIGQVARAFDQVHEQAVRLAAEQAGLRSAFNSIFVNLSRRSQALVERQLRLIEQLENSEEDPEALSNLFQLDHLATRMRRNSENLLVLSGTDLSRRGSRPVPLVDVLRAAASEVEQYQRIDLAPPPSAQLLGRTASDVVHLVAELLENATTFSAPDTRVRVQAKQNGDGSLLVEIIDSGVGMSEEDLHDANVRLDSPPTVDVSASRRMGLFVVGRLATRHGITVSLRNREDGGVAATALVPASAVLAVAPEGAATPAVTAGASAGASRSVPEQARGGGSGLPQRGQRQGGGAPGSFFAPGVDPEQGGGDAARPGGARERRSMLPRRGSSNGAAGTNGSNGSPGHGTNGTNGSVPGPAGPGRPGGPTGPARPGLAPSEPPREPVGRAPAEEPETPEAPAEDTAVDGAGEQDERGRHGLVGGAAAGGAAALIGAAAARRRSRRSEDGAEDAAPDAEAPAADEVADADGADGDAPESGEADAGRHVLRPTGLAPGQGPGPTPGQGPGPAPGPMPSRPGSGGPAGPGWGPPGAPRGGPPPGWRGPGAPPGRGPAGPGWGPPPGGPGRPAAAGPPMWNGAPVVPPPGPGPAESDEAPAEVVDDVENPVETPAEASGEGSVETPVDEPADERVEDTPEAAAAPTETPEAAAPLPTRRGTFPLRPRVVRPQPQADAAESPAESPADATAATPAGPTPEPEQAVEEPAAVDAAEPVAEDPASAEPEESEDVRPARPSGRRLSPSGVPFAPGMAPRLRPRRTGPPSEGEDAAEQQETPGEDTQADEAPAAAPDEVPAAEPETPAGPPPLPGGLPRRTAGPPAPNGAPAPGGLPQRPSGPPAPSGPSAPGALPQRSARPPQVPAGANGSATGPGDGARLFDAPPPADGEGRTRNGGGPPGRVTPERPPGRPGAPQRERTPIYDEVASAWFREAPPSAGPDEAEWASSSGDEGWRAAAATADALDTGVSAGGTTEAGLPKRRPRAQLVPGAARSGGAGAPGGAPDGAAAGPRRNADAIRGRLASYQRGVADGRTSRQARPADTGAERDARSGDEEEQ
ncbi:nitrate- and nitrite sensing domain-containing protein [Actinomycetospora callitridis]|uniref:nitrate- and nitrite sensing domain-containing protein n=1 Tax=Actinomycetospora callitridis TaxID=913944 RepID=UPI002365567D|nr:nitrate- and nitrite sensing domain-containing protein [Actinomycetospora callitridis]MDD7919742.1 nitrate- and nitrite sensing domain-containing protein [Actinomycetospora callitridis]